MPHLPQEAVYGAWAGHPLHAGAQGKHRRHPKRHRPAQRSRNRNLRDEGHPNRGHDKTPTGVQKSGFNSQGQKMLKLIDILIRFVNL